MAMYSPCDDTTLLVPGCPIRKSPDRRLLSTSPKLIAASHVLLRLLTPRHPPCALNSLVTSSWVSYLANSRSRAFARARISKMHSPTRYSVVKDRSLREKRAALAVFANGPSRVTPLPNTARENIPANGGADRDRTDDLRLAKPALSQLSYSPSGSGGPRKI
jgi:hypothetical protein